MDSHREIDSDTQGNCPMMQAGGITNSGENDGFLINCLRTIGKSIRKR